MGGEKKDGGGKRGDFDTIELQRVCLYVEGFVVSESVILPNFVS